MSHTRPPMSRSRLPRALATGLAASLLLSRPTPGRADDPGEAAGHHLALGLLSGLALPDPSLSDYQWQMTPRIGWGAEALMGGGRYAGGLRVWTAASEQDIGAAGAPASTTVTRTSLELVGRVTVAQLAGLELFASAAAGRIHLGYQPDRVSIPSSGGSVEVSFEAIDEWIGGAGFGARRALAHGWSAGLELEHRIFALDTSHRSGTTVVSERSTFGDWSARLALTRHLHW